MVDLTKGINNFQSAIQKTASQVTTPKTAEIVADEVPQKLAEDIKKVDAIAQMAKTQATLNIPDYVQNMLKHINRK